MNRILSAKRTRRVRVTARSRWIAAGQVTGRDQIGTEKAAPAESRTPTGTAAQAAIRVRMETGRQGRGKAGGRRQIPKTQLWAAARASPPFPPDREWARRPPVKAALRLAALGLDGTRPPRSQSTDKREWRVLARRCWPAAPAQKRCLTRAGLLMETATVRERNLRPRRLLSARLREVCSSVTSLDDAVFRL